MFNFTGSYILNDLTPSTQYSVYIRAVRLVGVKILEGSQSSNIIVTTKTLFTAGTVDQCYRSTVLLYVLTCVIVLLLIMVVILCP